MKSNLLEFYHSFFTVLLFCTFWIFTRFIWATRQDGYEFARPAIAINVLILGDMIIRGTLWIIRHAINSDIPLSSPDVGPTYWLVLLGGLISIVGVACCIRVFSPYEWGDKPFYISVGLALAVAIVSVLN